MNKDEIIALLQQQISFLQEQLHEANRKADALLEEVTSLRNLLEHKWTDGQEERAKLLFGEYPKLKEAYGIINSLRGIFKGKSLTKDSARTRFHEWYGKVTESTLREIKSVRDTIKTYEDEILNYFISRATNVSAESLNSKLKAFRSQLRGVRDIPFFFYRVSLVFG